MTTNNAPANLLTECKIGLNLSLEPNDEIDKTLDQKINAVKMYMIGAGVREEMITSPLGIGVVVMGVTDLWELRAGEVKFSPVFHTLVTQLA